VFVQEELERESAYFDTLEKTEKMEMKMDSIKEIKCKAYSCPQVSFILCYYLCVKLKKSLMMLRLCDWTLNTNNTKSVADSVVLSVSKILMTTNLMQTSGSLNTK